MPLFGNYFNNKVVNNFLYQRHWGVNTWNAATDTFCSTLPSLGNFNEILLRNFVFLNLEFVLTENVIKLNLLYVFLRYNRNSFRKLAIEVIPIY